MLPQLLVLAAAIASAQTHGWNVLDYGAKPDGRTDNTAAFQKALDAAGAAGGGVVHVPAGRYRFEGVLSIPAAVTLQGIFHVPPTDQREGRPELDGSVLLAYAGRGAPADEPFIRLAGSMATLAGFIVAYPEWKVEDVPPVPYPPTVYATGNANAAVIDCCLLGAYEGIHFQDSHRFLVRNVYGYPSYRGFYVDNCLDIGRVENCHFWPFGLHGRSAFQDWVNENGVAFEFARSDWQYVSNTFCFGYGVGYKFSRTENGSCNGSFVAIGADCCRRGVYVETRPETLDLLISNGEFVGRWYQTDSVGIEIAGPSTQRVSLNNCAFWGPLDRAVWSHAPQGNVALTACGLVFWDSGARDSPAVQIDGGKAILQGNTFSMEGFDVRVGREAASALLVGNQAPAGLTVENHAGPRTQMSANNKHSVEWPRHARRHYRIELGSLGDSAYVRGFHSRELARPWNEEGTMRWGGATPRLVLPVEPGKPYTLTMEAHVPAEAIDEHGGLYLGDRCLAPFPGKPGNIVVEAVVPPQRDDRVELTLRAKVWRAKPENPTPDDARPLTVGVRRLTMSTSRARGNAFDANTGGWAEAPAVIP